MADAEKRKCGKKNCSPTTPPLMGWQKKGSSEGLNRNGPGEKKFEAPSA